jgi:hypothetical protein
VATGLFELPQQGGEAGPVVGVGGLLALEAGELLFQARHPLDGVLHDAGGAALAHGDPGRCGVQHTQRLVGQAPAGEVALRERHRVVHGVLADAHMVVALELGGHGAQHLDGGLGVGLVDLDHLEAPGQGRVALHVLLVLVPGGGCDGAQLATGEGRLEDVGGVGLSGRPPGADEGVGFVDEEDDRLDGRFHLGDHGLEAFFELALEAGARLQEGEIELPQGDAT